MNALQSFLVGCSAQARANNQEAATVNLSPTLNLTGSFGDPQLMPLMTRNGYQDHLVTTFQATDLTQFAGVTLTNLARKNLTRTQTGRVFFIHAVDYTSPVAYTFLLVDREI